MGCASSSTGATQKKNSMDGMMSKMMENVSQMQQAQLAKQEQLVREDPECAQIMQRQAQLQQKMLLAVQSGDAAGQMAAQREMLELQQHPKWMKMMMPDVNLLVKGGGGGGSRAANNSTFCSRKSNVPPSFPTATATAPPFGANNMNDMNNMLNMNNMFNNMNHMQGAIPVAVPMMTGTTATTYEAGTGTGTENGLSDSTSMFANLMHGSGGGGGLGAGGGGIGIGNTSGARGEY